MFYRLLLPRLECSHTSYLFVALESYFWEHLLNSLCDCCFCFYGYSLYYSHMMTWIEFCRAKYRLFENVRENDLLLSIPVCSMGARCIRHFILIKGKTLRSGGSIFRCSTVYICMVFFMHLRKHSLTSEKMFLKWIIVLHLVTLQ